LKYGNKSEVKIRKVRSIPDSKMYAPICIWIFSECSFKGRKFFYFFILKLVSKMICFNEHTKTTWPIKSIEIPSKYFVRASDKEGTSKNQIFTKKSNSCI